jgi:hypothetical protein
MSSYTQITTKSGVDIFVRPNYKARTFSIKKNGQRYRTAPAGALEFEDYQYYTADDWQNFLNTSQNYFWV